MKKLSMEQLSGMIRLLLKERRFLIHHLESHMRRRMNIKKQSEELQGYVEMMSLLLTDLMNLA